MTPVAASLSSRACTVPRATPSRRDASRTPTRGSSAKRSINLPSRSSMLASVVGQVAQCFCQRLHTLRYPGRLRPMTTTHHALTADELKADLTLEQLQQ